MPFSTAEIINELVTAYLDGCRETPEPIDAHEATRLLTESRRDVSNRAIDTLMEDQYTAYMQIYDSINPEDFRVAWNARVVPGMAEDNQRLTEESAQECIEWLNHCVNQGWTPERATGAAEMLERALNVDAAQRGAYMIVHRNDSGEFILDQGAAFED